MKTFKQFLLETVGDEQKVQQIQAFLVEKLFESTPEKEPAYDIATLVRDLGCRIEAALSDSPSQPSASLETTCSFVWGAPPLDGKE